MIPADIDRVFGRSRLKMVTGEHVEVFREESQPGERRRYTKRFLATPAGDFRQWTEREWRILARLVGHGIGPVPDVVQFDRGAVGRPALVQTYDAGVTVDHWATLLPVRRIKADDAWCEDPADRRYNRPIRLLPGAVGDRLWRNDQLYDLIIELDHNTRPRIARRGSAVFVHIARRGFAPTAGCVALAPKSLTRLLAQIDLNTRITIL